MTNKLLEMKFTEEELGHLSSWERKLYEFIQYYKEVEKLPTKDLIWLKLSLEAFDSSCDSLNKSLDKYYSNSSIPNKLKQREYQEIKELIPKLNKKIENLKIKLITFI